MKTVLLAILSSLLGAADTAAKHTVDTDPGDTHAIFRVRLPAGMTQLLTTLMDAKDGALCSAIYTYLRRLDDEEAKAVELTPSSDRKPKE